MALEYILGIDYGERRVGVAIAHEIARLPRPLTTLENDDNLIARITEIVQHEHVRSVIVGVPRNMDGSESEQSARCLAFADELKTILSVPVHTVDETLSSVEAERRLKTSKNASHGVDAEAAAIILERYFAENQEGTL